LLWFLQVIGVILFDWHHLFFWVQVCYIWDFACSLFSYYSVFFNLLTCYFAGVVWWALVAAVTENRFIGELFFS
jgi:hypothetical protein